MEKDGNERPKRAGAGVNGNLPADFIWPDNFGGDRNTTETLPNAVNSVHSEHTRRSSSHRSQISVKKKRLALENERKKQELERKLRQIQYEQIEIENRLKLLNLEQELQNAELGVKEIDSISEETNLFPQDNNDKRIKTVAEWVNRVQQESVLEKEEELSSAGKVYGCQMHVHHKMSESINDHKQYEISEIYKEFLENPKSNNFGLCYQGLDRTQVNLFKSSNLVVRDNKKFTICGQTFGVGAFESEDDNIYCKEDMSNYDFELTKEKNASKSSTISLSTANTEKEDTKTHEVQQETIETLKPIDLTDKLDVADKTDLFKAVFLSSDSESEDEHVPEIEVKKEQDKTEAYKAAVLSDVLIPKIKPLKEGILSHVNSHIFTKPVTSNSNQDAEKKVDGQEQLSRNGEESCTSLDVVLPSSNGLIVSSVGSKVLEQPVDSGLSRNNLNSSNDGDRLERNDMNKHIMKKDKHKKKEKHKKQNRRDKDSDEDVDRDRRYKKSSKHKKRKKEKHSEHKSKKKSKR